MLHILLTILKVIGILLLSIIGIILVILLAVLLIPICYEVQGEKEEERIKALVAVSWLFKGINAKFRFENKQGNFEVYIFGIPLLSTLEKLKERKAKKEQKKEETKKVEEEGFNKQVMQSKEQVVLEGDVKEKEPDEEPVNVDNENDEKEEPVMNETKSTESPALDKQTIEDNQSTEDSTKEEKKSGVGDKLKSLWNTICGIPSKVKASFEKIRLTIQQMCAKIDWWKNFIQKDSTKKALKFLLGEGKTMLKHILPRKVSGNVLYGLEDPALTGQILAVLSALYPYYHKDLEIIPFFDQNILEGRLKIKGRIILGFFVIHGIKIICNREIIRTYKILRHKEA